MINIKNKKRTIVVFLVIAIVIGFVIYIYNRSQNTEEAVLNDPGQVYEEHVKPQIFVENNTVKTTLYLPKADLSGYEKKEVEYKGEGLDIQKQIINDLLFNYLKDKIQIPEGVTVLDLKVWDETLRVNFSKEATGMKVNDPRAEKYVIGAIVNSLLTTSNEFTDVQFLVEGERVDALFGHINTRNPFMFVK